MQILIFVWCCFHPFLGIIFFKCKKPNLSFQKVPICAFLLKRLAILKYLWQQIKFIDILNFTDSTVWSPVGPGRILTMGHFYKITLMYLVKAATLHLHGHYQEFTPDRLATTCFHVWVDLDAMQRNVEEYFLILVLTIFWYIVTFLVRLMQNG